MKATKTIVLLVVMLNIATCYAVKNVIDVPAVEKAVLRFYNVKKGHHYKIIDNKGVILFTEIINRNGTFLKQFDFTDLNIGSYTIELEKDFEIIITPFIIQSNNVIFLKAKEKTIFKPLVRVKNDKLLISKLALNNEHLGIELYYNGELIHKDELKDHIILNQVYGLSKDYRGDYYVRLTSENRKFIQHFKF